MNNQVLWASSLGDNSCTNMTTGYAVLIKVTARALHRLSVDDAETHRMVQPLNLEQGLCVSFDAKRGRLLDGLRQLLVDIFRQ